MIEVEQHPWLKSHFSFLCHSSQPTIALRLASQSKASKMKAEALSRKEEHVGAVAFSGTGGPVILAMPS